MPKETQSTSRSYTAAIVVIWYACNIGVALSNKALLSRFGFKYPFLLTLLHMITCSFLSAAVGYSGMVPMQLVQNKKQFLKIVLLSAVFCMTVVLGNVSLKYIPISFNQAISATTPAFTAALAILIQRHFETALTYFTLVPVVGGIVVASAFEPSFNLIGFSACVGSTALRGFKSILQGMLLDKSEKMGSMALLAHMAPISAILLIPLTLLNEYESLQSSLQLIQSSGKFSAFLMLNCLLAYFVNLTNFLVTQYCGALTLQVLGNAKGAVAAVISVLVFRNPVSVVGWLGYGITMAGVAAYSHAKQIKPAAAVRDVPEAEKLPLIVGREGS